MTNYLFHGTSHAPFEEFKQPSLSGESGGFGPGIFLTPFLDHARKFARNGNSDGWLCKVKLKVPANEWVFREESIDVLPMALRERLPTDILTKMASCCGKWFDSSTSAEVLHACGIMVLVSEDNDGSETTKQQFQVLDNKVLEIVEWYRVPQSNAHNGLWHVTDSRQLMTWDEIRKTGERVLPSR